MTVKQFMVKSGIPLHLKGYDYLKTAIEIHIENPEETVYNIIEKVGEMYNYSDASIERCIRTAIKNGFENMDKDIKSIVFKTDAVPSIAQYIKSVSYAIRYNLI